MKKFTTVSKKMLAMLLAMLTLCSCMAVSASAANEGITAANCVINPDKPDRVEVTKVVVNSIAADITVTTTADAAVSGVEKTLLADGTTRFEGLKTGSTYRFVATVTDTAGTVISKTSVDIALKKSQTTPSKPVAADITSSSIRIDNIEGCEYKIEGVDVTYSKDWNTNPEFTGLSSGKYYTISIRKKETTDAYASAAASITVKTKLPAALGAPAALTLEDKTNTTITVKKPASANAVEYSIDGGKTWQSSNTFTGLSAGKLYSIIARYSFDATAYDPNPATAPLEVKTNAKATYVASLAKCTVTFEEGDRYADDKLDVTVTADAPTGNPQYGDTKLVPAEIRVDGVKVGTITYSKSKKCYVGDFTPGSSNANKKITVTIVYNVEEYNGAEWKEVYTENDSTKLLEVTKDYKVDIGPVDDIWNKLKEAVTAVLNVLLNTIPSLITGAMQSDIWGKLFEAIGNMGK